MLLALACFQQCADRAPEFCNWKGELELHRIEKTTNLFLANGLLRA
jgi:hypothetical protein